MCQLEQGMEATARKSEYIQATSTEYNNLLPHFFLLAHAVVNSGVFCNSLKPAITSLHNYAGQFSGLPRRYSACCHIHWLAIVRGGLRRHLDCEKNLGKYVFESSKSRLGAANTLYTL